MNAQVISYKIDADPVLVARIEAKRQKALKPCCMRCEKTLTAKRELTTRVCFDREACTRRQICSFRAPKGVSWASKPNHTWASRV